MAYDFQVVLDCAEPHVLADWWAETLGWEVEPQNADFIREMVAKGFASDADTTVHNGTLRWREGQAITNPGSPRVLFQLVPEGKTVKNRMHLDLRIGTDDVDTLVEKLKTRGATFLHNGRQGPHTWVTMADPEGNEFCVSQSPPSAGDDAA
jgi:glyoxalase superfamily protein